MGRLVISRYTSFRQRGSLEHIYIETTTKYIDLVPNIYEALPFLAWIAVQPSNKEH